ncbi:MAG: hypothetical protein AABW79_04975 [Nanoarchaeota archaeon]
MTEHNHKVEEKKEEVKKMEEPTSEKKSDVKKTKKPVVKKEFAVARSNSLHISLKHSMYVSRFIRGKTIDQAIADLNDVIAFKRAVPFKGEIPHRKGKMMSGRYPITAAKNFILVLRALKGNVLVNGMDAEKARITISNPSWDSRPMRRGGVHAKRVNLLMEAREVEEKKNG